MHGRRSVVRVLNVNIVGERRVGTDVEDEIERTQYFAFEEAVPEHEIRQYCEAAMMMMITV